MRRALVPIRSVVLAAAIVASATASSGQTTPPPAAPPLPQAPSPPAPPPAAKPPIVNRANELLPPWLRVRGELRERAEGFRHAGFTDGSDDLYYLSRVRLNVAASGRVAAATVQLQDARVGAKRVGPVGTPFKATFDLRQAFIDLGPPNRHVVVRAGRQELAFGDQRLVGHAGWLNAARTFDGGKVTVKGRALQIDAFATSVVRILDGEFDKSGRGNRFAGVYGSAATLLPKATVEPYLFYRRDENVRPEIGAPADFEQVTAGVRVAGRLPASLDYNVEMAAQTGAVGSEDVSAWAGHWLLRAALPGRTTPRVTGEYNVASGDKRPGDGTRGTFDQLYPTAHDKYGLADLVGWRNIHHVRIGVEVTPMRATPISVSAHAYRLAQPRDALYAASSAVIARAPDGSAGADVGREVDVQMTRPLTPQLALAAGYAHLFPGRFLRRTTPGESYSGAFMMLTYVFLAER